MSEVVIFVGPSLNASDCDLFSNFSFQPPIADGDIFALSSAMPKAIGIIDGYFGDRLAIFHKEILWGIANGIRIYGAASMGALRAAELDTYGMIGVGEIYNKYSTGEICRDDAVAVCHGPREVDYLATSVSLVDMAATIDGLHARGQIQPDHRDALIAAAETLYFGDRTWTNLEKEALKSCSDLTGVSDALSVAHVQTKRLDALMLLEQISQDEGRNSKPVQGYWPPATPAFKTMLTRSGIANK